MVSIPDWSRFQRLINAPAKEPCGVLSRYYKQREEEAIKQAEEQGYFLTPARDFLEDTFLEEEEEEDIFNTKSILQKKKERDLSTIFLIKLSSLHLPSVGDIGLCNNLTICMLGKNYIKRIDPLVNCIYLMKLDLHSNQITNLPGPSFWISLQFLKFLYLHDNPIGKIENLKYLSQCRSLGVLTMYDTPLSLKRNYRHHVVNSLWSLKALDHFVISDEEIIEDASFGGRFEALSQSFAIDLCPSLPDENLSYEDELQLMNTVWQHINSLMAHFSPVLIIQRYIRGYLVRKATNRTLWIKSSWPIVDNEEVENRSAPTVTPEPHHLLQNGPSDTVCMDYDTYLANRRPGSTNPQSEPSARNSRAGLQIERDGNYDIEKKNIYVNLAKLHNRTLQTLKDDAMSMLYAEGPILVEDKPVRVDNIKHKKWKEDKQEKPKRKIIKDIRQFFGKVVENMNENETDCGDEEDIPLIGFRLRGWKKSIRLSDPTMEMIFYRKDSGNDVRRAEDEYHFFLENVPKPSITREPTMSRDQKMFNKVQGTMSMACLNAIQQAYRDREKLERRAVKTDKVLALKEQRDSSKQRIKLYKDEQRNKYLRQRGSDHKYLVQALEQREMYRLNYLDKRDERRNRSSMHSRERKRDVTFMGEFNIQNTSVSKALLRHDRQQQNEEKIQHKLNLVKDYRSSEKEQQSMVKKYLEHRTMMRQTESAMSRASLDTRMLQEANERIMDARSRIAQQKAKSAHIEAAAPTIHTPLLPPVVKHQRSQNMRGLDKWNTDVELFSMNPIRIEKAFPTTAV